MIVRIVAGLREKPYFLERVREPTGSAVRM
jgi:hypothetical protein